MAARYADIHVSRVLHETQERMASYSIGNEAHKPTGPDVKWRYFWRLRCQDSSRESPEQVFPAGFPDWPNVMDEWGHSLLQTAETVSELLAVAYNLPEDTFTGRMVNGDHLLAPTGMPWTTGRGCQGTRGQRPHTHTHTHT